MGNFREERKKNVGVKDHNHGALPSIREHPVSSYTHGTRGTAAVKREDKSKPGPGAHKTIRLHPDEKKKCKWGGIKP